MQKVEKSLGFSRIHYVNIRGLNIAYRKKLANSVSHFKGVNFYLHGFMDHSGTWEEIENRLPSDFVHIAFDFRGQGDSSWAPPCVSAYQDYEYVVDAILFIEKLTAQIHFEVTHSRHFDSLELKFFSSFDKAGALPPLPVPVSLVGHSFGANISLLAVASKKLPYIKNVFLIEPPLLKPHSAESFSDLYTSSYPWILSNGIHHDDGLRLFDTEEAALKKISALHFSRNPAVAMRLAKNNVKNLGGQFTYKFDHRISTRFSFNSFPESLTSSVLNSIGGCNIFVVLAENGLYSRNSEPAFEKVFGKASFTVKWMNGGHHLHMEPENAPAVAEYINAVLSGKR